VIDLTYQILIAVLLDLILGDPKWLPHPVRLIGWFAVRLEAIVRRLIRSERLAGLMVTLSIIIGTGLIAWLLLWVAASIHPVAVDVLSIVIIYTCIAARDLAVHAIRVRRPLIEGDLAEARRRVAMIVGRDTERLDEQGVARATVESVAENLVDGVTAPLFYAVLFGPVGAIVYKAINTLDSMFGYKNERYIRFGWSAARIDDVANFLPARLTAPPIAIAALLIGGRPVDTVRILVRDRKSHTSPNAGYSEAAFAGAMGVQLGGPSYYFGKEEPVEKPLIGDSLRPIEATDIGKAIRLMFATTGLFLAVMLGARALGEHFWLQGGWTL